MKKRKGMGEHTNGIDVAWFFILSLTHGHLSLPYTHCLSLSPTVSHCLPLSVTLHNGSLVAVGWLAFWGGRPPPSSTTTDPDGVQYPERSRPPREHNAIIVPPFRHAKSDYSVCGSVEVALSGIVPAVNERCSRHWKRTANALSGPPRLTIEALWRRTWLLQTRILTEYARL